MNERHDNELDMQLEMQDDLDTKEFNTDDRQVTLTTILLLAILLPLIPLISYLIWGGM